MEKEDSQNQKTEEEKQTETTNVNTHDEPSFSQSYRNELLRAYDDIVFPLVFFFNNYYWKNVFQHREENDAWKDISPFVDSIKMCMPLDPNRNKGMSPPSGTVGEIEFFSTNYNCPLFWDAIFSYYLIRHPEIYKSPVHMIKTFYQTMEKTGAAPTKIRDFSSGIIEYMDKILKGELTFNMIEQPVIHTFKMYWLLTMNAQFPPEKMTGKDGRYDDPQVQEAFEKTQKYIEDHFKDYKFE